MPTKLRRSLYIGLGGTGMNTILRTKKMFMENYGGKVPPMIAFLGIDTDKAAYERKLMTNAGDVVSLSGSEQCSISVTNPRDKYSVLKKNGFINWMFEDTNIGAIQTLDRGAGQVRTNGRLAFSLNFDSLRSSIDRSISAIYNVNIANNELYEVIDAPAEIHIIYSVSGGTGAGTFIDVGYLVQLTCKQGNYPCNINGYAVLPNIFKSMQPMGPQMARVQTNGYAAVKDLDFLMSLDNGNAEAINLQWSDYNYTLDKGPYDNVCIVDNTNINGEKLPHINDIAEAISLVLVSSAGSMVNEEASLMDNVKVQRSQKFFDIEKKMGWVSSIGASEIVFNSKSVADVYAKKAASRIIKLLMTSNGQANTKANTWIDSVAIRENMGNDQLIDFLYDMKRLITMTEITNLDNPLPEVEVYINQAVNRDLKSKVDEKLDFCIKDLDNLYVELLNGGNSGVALAKETLLEISKQLDIFVGEMKVEQSMLCNKDDSLRQQMNNAISEVKEVAHKLFGGGKARSEAKDALYERAKIYSANKLEISRRINAIGFFTSLKNHIDKLLVDIDTLWARLSNLADMLDKQVIDIQSSAKENSSFVEIDLSQDIVTKVEVNDSELIIADFINTLHNKDLMCLGTSKVAENAIMDFANNLPGTIDRRSKTVDDALNELSEEKFDHIFDLAVIKASPLLKINDRGHGKIHTKLSKSYYICVPNTTANRLTRTTDDDPQAYYEKNIVGTTRVKPISTGLNDKVIIFRQEGAYPAFAIACIDSFKNDYINDNMSPHFDKVIYERMLREDHDLMPKEVDATADALEAWVFGLIYGYIKYENDMYMFKDWEDKTLALNEYWVKTKETFRDRAFTVFSGRVKSIREQYAKKAQAFIDTQGSAKYNELWDDVKTEGVYFEKYSQCPVTKKSLQGRSEYQPTCDLLTREINFVKDYPL